MTKDKALKLAQTEQKINHAETERIHPFKLAKGEKGVITYSGNGSAEWRDIEAPTGFFFQVDGRTQPEERNFCPRCGKRTADSATIHTCTPPVAADNGAFYGFPQESVSTPNAGGKCVTAGETAPVRQIDPNAWAFDRGLEST